MISPDIAMRWERINEASTGDLRRLELTMNCAQCQAANGPEAVYCRNCGAQLAPAGAPAGAGGYSSPPPAPPGYNAAGGSGGYGAPAGYGAPGGYNAPPSSGYGPASGQAPAGYQQGQHAQGQHAQGQHAQGQYQQGQYQRGTSGPFVQNSSGLSSASFDLARLTRVDKIVAGATLITMISLWLPWYTGTYSVVGELTSSGSVSGTGDHGWLWLEFILALVLLAYLVSRAVWNELPFRLPVAHTPLLIAGTCLQFLFILNGFLALPSTDGVQGLSVSWDFGAFLALIASIVAFAPVAYPLVKSYLDKRNAGASPGR
jgi:hypothetical protein